MLSYLLELNKVYILFCIDYSMKIEVNIEKRYAVPIIILLGVVAGLFLVIAYNPGGSGGVPIIMGHSVDEIDWNQVVPSPLNGTPRMFSFTDCLIRLFYFLFKQLASIQWLYL